MARRYHRWSVAEDKFLKDNYKHMSDQQLARNLGIGERAIQNRRSTLNLSPKVPRWTPQEDALLKQHYALVPVSELAAILERTEEATRMRMGHLKLPLEALERNQKAWKQNEDELIANHRDEPIPEIQRLLPYRRTIEAVYRRARTLGRTSARKNCSIRAGYTYIYLNQAYVPQHRYVLEESLGRELAKSVCVHHINGDKQDNRPGNLYPFKDRSSHRNCHVSIELLVGPLLEIGAIEFDKDSGIYKLSTVSQKALFK